MGDRFENTAIIETPDLDDYIRLVTKEGGTRRALASELAKKIVEEYEGSTLGGEERTIQAAIADAKQVASEAIQEEQTDREEADTTITADLAKKAYADGEYADLHAGTANQLLADTYTTDEEPYHYRATPSNAGTREIDEIVGGSVVWNQLCNPSNYSNTGTFYGITITKNSDGTVEISGTATGNIYFYFFGTGSASIGIEEGHKCLICGCPSGGSSTTYCIQINNDRWKYEYGNGMIISAVSSASGFGFTVRNGAVISGTMVFKPMLIDLTAMFGSTIADHIYSLEQATAGAGVAFFRKYFPDEYYAYDVGTIRSVEGLVSHETTGFNQWDEEWELGWIDDTGANRNNANIIRSKSYIPVFPSAAYYFKTPQTSTMMFYDENKNCLGHTDANGLTDITGGGAIRTTLSNCRYIRFWTRNSTTYNHDICINISNTAKNGTYEPYEKHSYPLDNTVTLRGIPQLVDGKLKWNGDIYPPSGLIKRRYKEVTFDGSSDEAWTLAAAYNGTNYKHSFFRIVISGITVATTATAYTEGLFAKGAEVKHLADNEEYNSWTVRKTNGVTAIYVLSPTSEGDTYASLSAFKTFLASNPITLICELATPTTEQAEPYQSLQICSPYGTEEYVSTSIVPVGHYTKYPTDLKGIVEQIADAPSADGTYTLKATVSGGKVTYSWESV